MRTNMKHKKLLISLVGLILAITLFAALSGQPEVERSSCVGCGDCVKHCPTSAINLRGGRAAIDPELCINCGFCVRTCTYRAIRTPK